MTKVWAYKYRRTRDTARKIIEGLRSSSPYPNIHTILHLLLINPPEPSYKFCLKRLHMLTFIRYIEVSFTIALLDCVCYIEDFVKSRFCSIHFIVILAGLKKIVPYSEDFVT